MALPANGSTHFILANYSFIDPERMKSWVGLVGWPVANGLPTLVVTHQLQVERRTGKVRQSDRRSTTVPHHQLWLILLVLNNFIKNRLSPQHTLLLTCIASSERRIAFSGHGRKLGKHIGRAHVGSSGIQPRAQPKAVLGWAWKGIELGLESASVCLKWGV